MNLQIIFCFIFVVYLASQATAYRNLKPISIEIDFSNYINKSEKDLVDDTSVNWVRTDYENAYVCQGQLIKQDALLFALLPKNGQFMASYIYARPKFSQPLFGDLITYPLTLPTTNGFVDFTFSQDKQTALRVFLWKKSDGRDKGRLIWQNIANSATPGILSTRIQITNLNGPFRLVFQAEVDAVYPYSSRTYLSQVVVHRVILNAS